VTVRKRSGVLELVAASVPEQGAGELDESEVVGGVLVVADEQGAAAF